MKIDVVSALLLPVVIVAVLPKATSAQAPLPTEPEYVGTVLWLDSSTGKLASLENQKASSHAKVKAGGFGGARVAASFKGATSPVRLTADQQLFVVRLDTRGLDPALTINLDALKASKSSREITLASAGPMGFGSKTAAGETMLKLIFEKYGEQSLKFKPAEKLPPGEYVITTKATGSLGYLLGVD